MKKLAAAAALVASLLLASGAAAQPSPTPPPAGRAWKHIHSASTMKTDGGSELRLPPGWFLDEDTWSRLDTEHRRLQDAETRLEAENERLLATDGHSGWLVVWTAGLALVAGGAGVLYWDHHR